MEVRQAIDRDDVSAGDRQFLIAIVQKASAQAAWVNITLPEDALRAIDTYAEAQGFTRSGFLLKAARRVLEGACAG